LCRREERQKQGNLLKWVNRVCTLVRTEYIYALIIGVLCEIISYTSASSSSSFYFKQIYYIRSFFWGKNTFYPTKTSIRSFYPHRFLTRITCRRRATVFSPYSRFTSSIGESTVCIVVVKNILPKISYGGSFHIVAAFSIFYYYLRLPEVVLAACQLVFATFLMSDYQTCSAQKSFGQRVHFISTTINDTHTQ